MSLELEGLRREIAELREDMQYAVRRMLQQQDREDMRQLLPIIHTAMGETIWAAADLYAAALIAQGPLQAALAPWNTESGGLRSFGRLLERCSGAVFDGLRLVEAGRDRAGALYLVKRVSAAQKHAAPVAPLCETGHDPCTHSQPVRNREPSS